MRGRTAGGRGRPQEPGASENLVRGLEAPFSGPEDWLPASDFCTGSSPPRRNDVSERPRPQPPRPPAPPHEPSPVTARGSARRSRAPGQRRVSCPNFHAAAASQRASTTFVTETDATVTSGVAVVRFDTDPDFAVLSPTKTMRRAPIPGATRPVTGKPLLGEGILAGALLMLGASGIVVGCRRRARVGRPR